MPYIVLLSLWATTAFADEVYRLDPAIAPTKQTIELHLDPGVDTFKGTTRLELNVAAPTDRFYFHYLDIEISRAMLTGPGGPIDLEIASAGPEGRSRADLSRAINPGTYALEFAFSGPYNTQAVGLYLVEYADQRYLFTQFQQIDARRVFPCWDEPSYKIPFQFIIHAPTDQRVFSNTPLAQATTAGDWQRHSFHPSKPLPSYLLALAIGPLETIPIPELSIPGRIITVAGQRHLAALAAEITPPILTALETYFNRPYPYAKLDLIAVPDFAYGAMENAGLITFRDEILLVDPQAASVEQKAYQALIVTHELAHMWFGDLVTMAWWDDLWLNESFASWLEYKITHQLFPAYRVDMEMPQDRIMADDARSSTVAVRRPVRVADDALEDLGLAYSKGQTVLGMVEQWLGADIFRQGVTEHIDAHAWKNATGADLWNALTRVSGQPVDRVMASFLDQSGLPLISIETRGRTLHISQRRFLNAAADDEDRQWHTPVLIKYNDGQTQIVPVLLTTASTTVELAKVPAWVFPHAGAYGYYRWQLPTADLLRLANHATDNLDPGERVMLLGNARALLGANRLSGDDYMQILSAYADDPDPLVIIKLINGLEEVRYTFIDEKLAQTFATYVRLVLSPALARFGLQQQDGEDEAISLLRPQLLYWLGRHGQDPAVARHATALAHAYMDDPTAIDPSLAGIALKIAAYAGDEELFNAYIHHYETAQIPIARKHYLAALGAFGDPALQDKALAYAIKGPLRANEYWDIPQSGIDQTPQGRTRVFTWFKSNYSFLVEHMPPPWLSYLPYFADGCESATLGDARAFFAQPAHQVDGTLNNLRKVEEAVQDCANLQQRELKPVTAYLHKAIKK